MSGDRAYQFGFQWGPTWVTRIGHIAGRGRLLEIKTDHAKVEIWVSEKGRKVRVWRDGKELA